MASREKSDGSPRDSEDRLPQEQLQSNEQTTDNPPMEGCLPNVPTNESISLPHLETLNLFCPLEPNPVRPAGLMTPRAPRMNPYTSDRVQNWIQNIRHSSSSGGPEDSPSSTTDMSDVARRLSSDSLNDQRFSPLRLPFATRPFSEGLLSHFLIPEVPNLSPLIRARPPNPVPSGTLLRPSPSSTPECTGRPEHEELLFHPRPRVSSRNRPEHTTTAYSGLFPCLSRMTTPHQTVGPRSTCTSRSLTPGICISSIGLRGSDTPLPSSRITPATPLQPRMFSFMMPSNSKPRLSLSVDSIRPMTLPNESSSLRVVLRPRRRVSLSASADILESSSVTPIANSIPVPTTDTTRDTTLFRPPSRNRLPRPDVLVPTTLESTRIQTIVLNSDLPTEILIPDRDSTTEAPILSHNDALTSFQERGETTKPSTILPNPKHAIPEVQLIRETKSAVQEISRIISIRNPNTNEVREYWVRQNATMLSEVAGFVNDTAAAAVTATRDRLNTINIKRKSSKKKNLKLIQRKRANPVPSLSSSSGVSPRQSAKSMSPQQRDAPPAFDPTKYIPPRGPRYRQIEAFINKRPKRPKKNNKSDSSGYPIWRDEVTSSSSCLECDRFVSDDATENQSTDPEFPEMTPKEKVETYLAHLQRQRMERDNEESE